MSKQLIEQLAKKHEAVFLEKGDILELDKDAIAFTLSQLEAFVKAYQAAAPIDNVIATCDWKAEDDDSMPSTYDGACGIKWSFIEDGLAENDCKFCPRCGGKINDITAYSESEELCRPYY
jgi:hypothetical protein